MAPRSSSAFGYDLAASERPALMRFLRKRVGASSAEDLAQEAICVLLESGGTDRQGSPIENPRGFLYAVAIRLVMKAYDERRRHEPLDDDDPPPHGGGVGSAARPEAALDARRALRCIASDPANRFLLLDAQEWTGYEIARARGSSAGAARVHLTARRKDVRTEYADYYESLSRAA